MHLTNYAINKLNPKFKNDGDEGEEENSENENHENTEKPSHKRSIVEFFNELRNSGYPVDTVWTKIKDIVVKTICSIQPILKHNYKTCHSDDPYNQTCFEILGFDVLIDNKFKPYLLEVNHSPSFRTDTIVDEKVKTRLIRDTLNILNVSTEMKNKLIKWRKKQKRLREPPGEFLN